MTTDPKRAAVARALRASEKAAAQYRMAAEARDTAVVAARQAGATQQQIAEATGLTHVGVLKLLRRMAQDGGAE